MSELGPNLASKYSVCPANPCICCATDSLWIGAVMSACTAPSCKSWHARSNADKAALPDSLVATPNCTGVVSG